MPITGHDWEIHIVRSREETRVGKAFARTVGSYRVFHDGTAVAQLSGTIVERQGPGDNTRTGVSKHRRVAAGTYELHTHDGAGNEKYKTGGYLFPTLGNEGVLTAFYGNPRTVSATLEYRF